MNNDIILYTIRSHKIIILKLFHTCAIQLCHVGEGPVPMALVYVCCRYCCKYVVNNQQPVREDSRRKVQQSYNLQRKI